MRPNTISVSGVVTSRRIGGRRGDVLSRIAGILGEGFGKGELCLSSGGEKGGGGQTGHVERTAMTNDPFWKLPDVPSFSLTSPDFAEGDPLPPWARSGIAGAGGDDRSPRLSWSGAPTGTKSFALTMYDPDAPTGSGWWHWAVHGIPASTSSLPSDAGDPATGLLPSGAITLPNEIRLPRYLGAAPPSGHGDHRYFFVLSALDTERLELDPESTPAYLGFVLRDHILGRAVLTGISHTD